MLNDWLTGTVVPFEAYSRDQASRVMRSCVMKHRADEANRRRAESLRYEPETEARPVGHSEVAPVVVEAIKRYRGGASMSEVRRFIDSLIPAAAPDDSPRYRCGTCCDRGTVEVWRMDVAARIDRGEMPLENATGSYVVACTCSAGDVLAVGTERRRPLPRYSDYNFCRFRGDDIETERRRLRQWLSSRVDSKKYKEFTAWAG